MLTAAHTDWAWAETMLPRVSRTFALSIRFLPPDVRAPVLLSYLLCRVADTVEDAPELAPAGKQTLLHGFAAGLTDPGVDLAPLAAAFAGRQDADAQLVVRATAVQRRHAGT